MHHGQAAALILVLTEWYRLLVFWICATFGICQSTPKDQEPFLMFLSWRAGIMLSAEGELLLSVDQFLIWNPG